MNIRRNGVELEVMRTPVSMTMSVATYRNAWGYRTQLETIGGFPLHITRSDSRVDAMHAHEAMAWQALYRVAMQTAKDLQSN